VAEGDLQLPRRHDAEIPPAKHRDYPLNPDHDQGNHKARVFASTLGIRQDDWEYLADQIMGGLDSAPVIGVRTEGPWGWLYEVRMPHRGSAPRATYLRRLLHGPSKEEDVASRAEAMAILTRLARDGKQQAAVALARELREGGEVDLMSWILDAR
jgi:hypothetical protein